MKETALSSRPSALTPIGPKVSVDPRTLCYSTDTHITDMTYMLQSVQKPQNIPNILLKLSKEGNGATGMNRSYLSQERNNNTRNG